MTAEMWHLIFNGFTAIGTVGAVVISLWVTLYRKRKFAIRDFSIDKFQHIHSFKKSCLAVEFENFLETPMEIKSVDIEFIKKKEKSRTVKGWTFKDEYTAPLSHHELVIPLQKEWTAGSLRSSDEINIIIKTTFGSRALPFPKRLTKTLCDRMEVPSIVQEKKTT